MTVVRGINANVFFYGYAGMADEMCIRDSFTARPDRDAVEKWAEAELRKVNFAFADGLVQYGIGGSITTLAAIELGKYDRDRVHEHKPVSYTHLQKAGSDGGGYVPSDL